MNNLNEIELIDDVRSMNIVRYSDSTTTHHYSLKGINSLYEEELEELLNSENTLNGSFNLNSYNFRIYGVAYETTDSYESSEEFAEEISETISTAIALFAKSKGGLDAIKA